ncbi:hypothetical protein [Tuwongella immobilis]|uniref:Uncharacterized protein n=1 Tax=Tuwongella immobilis TaxID=692036 RepID=A0A6C2YKC7_9BACT|nr:hypothetical protein [Tuwongella immobilis]VIP01563.1 unnamed protein product [Tuwongella immobilis]VTR98780.1 unnamed protein product [Tuwongella immobilis]
MMSLWLHLPSLVLGMGTPEVPVPPPVAPIVQTPGVLVDVERGMVIVNGQVIRWNPTEITPQPAPPPPREPLPPLPQLPREQPPPPPLDVAPLEPQPVAPPEVTPEAVPQVAPEVPAQPLPPVAQPAAPREVRIDGAANGVGRKLVIDSANGTSRTIIQNSRQGIGNSIIIDDGNQRMQWGARGYPANNHPKWTHEQYDRNLRCWLYWSAKDAAWFRYDANRKWYHQHGPSYHQANDWDDDWDD